MTNLELIAELKRRFPTIDEADTEMDGGDTVEDLVAWFVELGGEQLECDCNDRSWYGDEHDSECELAGRLKQ
jgi:hypothetical protein